MNDSLKNPSGNDERLKKHRRSSRLNYDDADIVSMFEADGCEVYKIDREIKESGTRRRVYKTIFYRASCGHDAEIRFMKYLQGQGRVCPKCARPRGENHFNYNPDLTDEERIGNRDTFDNVKWRTSVYERDAYTCQVCGDSHGGNLEAHHLNSYTDFPEERYDLSNGITLCKSCHGRFHHLYTYRHNTREQFEEWLKHDNTEVSA